MLSVNDLSIKENKALSPAPQLFHYRFVSRNAEALDYGRCYPELLDAMGVTDTPLSTEQINKLESLFKQRKAALVRWKYPAIFAFLVVPVILEFLGYTAMATMLFISMAGIFMIALTYIERLGLIYKRMFNTCHDEQLIQLAKWHQEEDHGELNSYMNQLRHVRKDRALYRFDYYLWAYWFNVLKPEHELASSAENARRVLVGEPLKKADAV